MASVCIAPTASVRARRRWGRSFDAAEVQTSILSFPSRPQTRAAAAAPGAAARGARVEAGGRWKNARLPGSPCLRSGVAGAAAAGSSPGCPVRGACALSRVRRLPALTPLEQRREPLSVQAKQCRLCRRSRRLVPIAPPLESGAAERLHDVLQCALRRIWSLSLPPRLSRLVPARPQPARPRARPSVPPTPTPTPSSPA